MRECIASYEAWTVVGNVKTGNGLFSFLFREIYNVYYERKKWCDTNVGMKCSPRR